MLLQDLRRRLVIERRAAEVEHVGEHAERVDVGARGHRLAADLLGRDVVRRPRDHVRHRILAGEVGEAPVEELHPRPAALAREEHVVELEVAVDDADVVRGAEDLAQLEQDPRDLLVREWAALESIAERLARQPFHHEVRAVRDDAGVEDVDDIRMVHRVDDARLEEEPVGGEPRSEHVAVGELQRGALAELAVAHAVHRAHPALAELALDDPRADQRARVELVGETGFPPVLARLSTQHRDGAVHVLDA